MKLGNATHQHVQAIRPILRSNLTPGVPTAVAYIAVYADTTSSSLGRNIILWDDVLHAFKDALHVRHGAVILPFLKGPDFKNLGPLRFAAILDIVLDIVVEGPLVEAATASSQDTTQETLVQEKTIASSPTTTARRNPAYGLVESAMQNYTHIDRPNADAPRLQGTLDDHCSDIDQTSSLTNEQKIVDTTTARAPQSHPEIIMQPPSGSVQGITKSMGQVTLEEKDDRKGPPRNPHTSPTLQPTPTPHPPIPLDRLIQSAEQGDIDSQIRLGNVYLEGRSVLQDTTKAMEWFLRAAEKNDPEAQCHIGNMYFKSYGKGEWGDDERGMEWPLKAARQGHCGAQMLAGHMYMLGRVAGGGGGEKGSASEDDVRMALQWYLKAERQGSREGKKYVGLMKKKVGLVAYTLIKLGL